jgi:hypothetical protein
MYKVQVVSEWWMGDLCQADLERESDRGWRSGTYRFLCFCPSWTQSLSEVRVIHPVTPLSVYCSKRSLYG